MRLRAFIVFALLLMVLSAAPAAAGVNQWTGSGPGEVSFEGGSSPVFQVAIDPADERTAYALVSEVGIFRTTDGGSHWTIANGGLPAFTTAIAIGAETTTVLYAAAQTSVYASVDGGRHFIRRGQLPPVTQITVLAAGPSARSLYAGTPAGIFVSNDGGVSWTAGATSADARDITSIAVARDRAVYATADAGLLRSPDSGRSWDKVDNAPFVMQVVADTVEGSIYAADEVFTPFDPQRAGTVYVSHDSGGSWQKLPDGPVVTRIAVIPGHSLYAGTNDGVAVFDFSTQTWTDVKPHLDGAIRMIAAGSSSRFYVAPDTGFFTMNAGDEQWSRATAGLPGYAVSRISVVPSASSTAYAVAGTGLYKTVDGQTWLPLSLPTNVHDVAVSSDPQATVWASAGLELEKSGDGGLTWTKVTANLMPDAPVSVAPSDPRTLYTVFEDGLARSSDSGGTWNVVLKDLATGNGGYSYYGYTPVLNTITINPQNPAHVFVTNVGPGAYKTADGGSTWDSLQTPWSARGVAFDGSTDSVVYAGSSTQPGIYKSVDGGAHWDLAGLRDKWVSALLSRGSHLYAGTGDGHLYRTDDQGAHWTGVDDGLGRAGISMLDADPAGGFIDAATAAGVYTYRAIGEVPPIAPFPVDADALSRLVAGAIIVPVAGSIRGADGTLYTTDVRVTNERAAPQDIVLIPFTNDGAGAAFRMTLPPSSDASGGIADLTDVASRLGFSGLASLAVIAVDADGHRDSGASTSASAHVWTHPADGRAPVGQEIDTVEASAALGHVHGRAFGLRHGGDFHANVGIVNLSSDWQQFTIAVTGDNASDLLTVGVPPYALRQLPLPATDYGLLSIEVSAADESVPWLFYGTTNDRITGEAATVTGSAAP